MAFKRFFTDSHFLDSFNMFGLDSDLLPALDVLGHCNTKQREVSDWGSASEAEVYLGRVTDPGPAGSRRC